MCLNLNPLIPFKCLIKVDNGTAVYFYLWNRLWTKPELNRRGQERLNVWYIVKIFLKLLFAEHCKIKYRSFFFYLHSFNSHRHYNSSNPLVSVVYSEFHFLLCKDSKCLIFSFPQYFKWAHCTNSVTNSVGVIFTGNVSKLILTNYLSRKRKTPFCPHPCCHELWMLFSYIEFPCIV